MATMYGELPTFSTVLSAYASISAIIMLLRTILNELIPKSVQTYITTKFSDNVCSYFSSTFTFVIEERWQAVENETFRAVEAYLPTKIGTSTTSLLLGSNDSHDMSAAPKIAIPIDCEVTDEFEGIKMKWKLRSKENKKYCYPREKRYFELSCDKKSRERLMNGYIPYICRTAKQILNQREVLNIYTYSGEDGSWDSAVFKHPSTFETLAMDTEAKQMIMDDLDTFVNRKEYFENVGRAWKRGYLLYGPPGTGKSSLVAAIANYMRYNIYDLQFQSVKNDGDLRRILTSTTNRSILLIEDIDCSSKVSLSRDRKAGAVPEADSSDDEDDRKSSLSFDPGATLSGLLNFIDGLWSSCGDERIIIFTTNHKEKLDPALLRPGRMDVHVYMGHCTPSSFKKLVTTYLGIKNHDLFSTIENLIQEIPITPAEVAQQLMKSDDPDIALESLVEFISKKGEEKDEDNDAVKQEEKIVKPKEVKKETKAASEYDKNAEIDPGRCIYLT